MSAKLVMPDDENRKLYFERTLALYDTNMNLKINYAEDLQLRSLSTFRGAPGEDPLKWLKEYDRVANFNKWDDMMCLANVYFFLDGTARQWYVNNEDALDSWEVFKNGLSGLFGDRQKYTRKAEEQLKCRAQRSGESTQSYIQSVLGLCQEVNPLMKEDEKV
ncbi:CCHC-type domain-containing protein [Trichonephila clavipes]|nr:CCHC-type domain-containing protein [Trichonephila clavipes]